MAKSLKQQNSSPQEPALLFHHLPPLSQNHRDEQSSAGRTSSHRCFRASSPFLWRPQALSMGETHGWLSPGITTFPSAHLSWLLLSILSLSVPLLKPLLVNLGLHLPTHSLLPKEMKKTSLPDPSKSSGSRAPAPLHLIP